MTSIKDYINIEPSNNMDNFTDNEMVENSVQNPVWYNDDEDNLISVVSEDINRDIKLETDILEDCTWLSKFEISNECSDQNTLLEHLHQNASNNSHDSTNQSTNHLNREDSDLNVQLENPMVKHQIRTQVKYEPYKCKKCGKQFKLNFSLNIHVKKYHLDLCKCDICSDFIDRTIINEHMKTHEKNYVEDKAVIIPNLKLCKLNGVWKSKPNCVYKCSCCFEKFCNENLLIEHMEIHKNNDDNTVNKDSSNIETQHTVTKLKDCNKKIYKCPKCMLRFDKKQLFVRHSIYCSKSSRIIWNKFRGKFKTNVNALFSCQICGLSFHNPMLLKNHMILGCNLRRCKNCGKTFNTKISWLKHMNLKQCVNSMISINKIRNQNLVLNNSRSKIKQCIKNVKISDQINAANKNEAIMETETHNLTVNDSNLNINQEKSLCANTIENNSPVPTIAVYSNASILQTVPDNLMINNCSLNIKKEKNVHTNSSGPINERNNNESITQMPSHSSMTNEYGLKIKKEEGLSKDIEEKYNSYDNHKLNSFVTSNVQSFKCQLAVKKEHVDLNTNNSCIERESVYFSIRKSQGNYVFICKICNKSSCKDLHSFALHVSDHKESTMHECLVCNETFDTVCHWKDHMIYHQEQMDLNLSKFQLNHEIIESNVLGTSDSESLNSQDGFTEKKQNKSSSSVNKSRNKFHCTICMTRFYTNVALTAHLQTVHSNSHSFSCKYCSRTFSTEGPYKNHEKSHTSEKNNLSLYNTEYNEQELIENQNNTKIVDTNVNIFTCKYCDRMFSTKDACINHEKLHFSDTNNLNTISAEDNKRSSMKNQSDNIKNTNVNIFTCKYCDRMFSTKDACINHEKLHFSDTNNLNTISAKDNKRSSMENQSDNIKSSNVNKFYCKYCGRMFSTKGACTNHEKSHISEINNLSRINAENNKQSSMGNQSDIIKNSNVNLFTCKYCGRMFSTKGACTNHEKSHISEINSLSRMSAKNNKQSPMENQSDIIKNSNVNIFTCKYCGRMFSTKGACTNHEKSHFSDTTNTVVHNNGDEENEPIETQDNTQIETSNINSTSIICENRNKLNKLICYVCGRKFLKPRYRTKHMILLHKINPNSPDQLVNNVKNKKIVMRNKKNMITTVGRKVTGEHTTKSSASVCKNSMSIKKNSISCSICKKHFAHPGALSSHMNTHSDLKPFKCKYCNRKFKMKGPMAQHEKCHESNQIQTVNTENYDGLEFGSDTSNVYPVTTYASSSKNNHLWFTCDACEKKFSTPFPLIIHRRLHSDAHPYVCKICNKSYVIRHRWNRHLKSHYLMNKQQEMLKSNQLLNNLKSGNSKLKIKPTQHKNLYKCGYCKKEFNLLSSWKKHLSLSKECRRHCKHSLPDFKPIEDKESYSKSNKFQCNICKKLYSTAYNRKVHILNVHKITVDNGTQCQLCGKIYSNKNNLARHYSSNHIKGNQFIKCDDCGKIFKHIYTYREHIRLKKFKIQNNTQVICSPNKTSVNKYSTVKYFCKICKLEFSNNKELQSHLKMHIPNKYKCNDCGQQFDTNFILGEHILKNHNAKTSIDVENENICKICSKVFKTSSYLSSHMRLHSGIKPYKCDSCNVAFRFLSNLKIHKKKHH